MAASELLSHITMKLFTKYWQTRVEHLYIVLSPASKLQNQEKLLSIVVWSPVYSLFFMWLNSIFDYKLHFGLSLSLGKLFLTGMISLHVFAFYWLLIYWLSIFWFLLVCMNIRMPWFLYGVHKTAWESRLLLTTVQESNSGH